MIAGSVCGLIDAATVTIKLSIFSCNEFSVVLGVKVDGALGGS